MGVREKNYTGAPGDFSPAMQKRALENKKEPLKIAIDCNIKACLNNVADLVNGMWKVAPQNKNCIFGLVGVKVVLYLTLWF